jgi:hypothetical protein
MLPPIEFVAQTLPGAVLGGCVVGVLSYIASRTGLVGWLNRITSMDAAAVGAVESSALASIDLEPYRGTERELRASVAAVGLDIRRLVEVRVFSPRAGTPAGQYPADVATLVAVCRGDGAYRGVEIAALADPQVMLLPHQSIWFCLGVLGPATCVTCFVAATPKDPSSSRTS